MAVLTLPEAAKVARNQGNDLLAYVIEIFAMRSPLLRVMPFQDIVGPGLIYNQEGALPGVAFRNVNEAYTPSVGVINPATEQLKIAGGEVQVDKFINRTMPGARAQQEAMQIKSLADYVQYRLIKGDSSASIKEFDGLQRRIPIGGTQAVSNGSTSGGDALSMAKLDEAIDTTEGATHLLMLKKVRRGMTTYLRGSASIQQTRDEFGRQLTSYAGLPILEADAFGVTAGLDNSEAATGGGTTATSIYVMRLEPGYYSGIQNGGMQVTDLGEMQSTPAFLMRLEWYMAQAIFHPRAVTRLHSILSSAAVVA